MKCKKELRIALHGMRNSGNILYGKVLRYVQSVIGFRQNAQSVIEFYTVCAIRNRFFYTVCAIRNILLFPDCAIRNLL